MIDTSCVVLDAYTEGGKVHIGLLSPGWPVNEFSNGIVTYVHNLRSELLKQGHRVSVLTTRIGLTNVDDGIYPIEASTRFRIERKLSRLFGQTKYDAFFWGRAVAAKALEIHRRDPIDILEMEESFGWCADVQERVPFPVVVKLHGPAFLDLVEEARETQFARARIEVEGRALARMPVIVSPAKQTLLDTVARYNLEPQIQKVLPNQVLAEGDVESWSLDQCDRKMILFVGRFDKRKGGDTALIAFRKLLEQDDGLKLIFIGPDVGISSEGGSQVSFDAFCKPLFTEAQRRQIQYLGRLPRVDISRYRRQAMVTLVLSRWDNQPNTALEAMLQGCPIVGTEVGGMNEIIEHGATGLLARPDDIVDLCEKIMSLLRDPAKARQMGENAYRFVTTQYSGERLAKETIDLYGEVISMAKSGTI